MYLFVPELRVASFSFDRSKSFETLRSAVDIRLCKGADDEADNCAEARVELLGRDDVLRLGDRGREILEGCSLSVSRDAGTTSIVDGACRQGLRRLARRGSEESKETGGRSIERS